MSNILYQSAHYTFFAPPVTAPVRPLQTIKPTMHSTTTAKKTSRAIRVWLENKNLLEYAGFVAGSKYTIETCAGMAVLVLDSEGPCTVSSCKRGDKVRPIIDLHSKLMASVFKAGQSVTVEYNAELSTIVIMGE